MNTRRGTTSNNATTSAPNSRTPHWLPHAVFASMLALGVAGRLTVFCAPGTRGPDLAAVDSEFTPDTANQRPAHATSHSSPAGDTARWASTERSTASTGNGSVEFSLGASDRPGAWAIGQVIPFAIGVGSR